MKGLGKGSNYHGPTVLSYMFVIYSHTYKQALNGDMLRSLMIQGKAIRRI